MRQLVPSLGVREHLGSRALEEYTSTRQPGLQRVADCADDTASRVSLVDDALGTVDSQHVPGANRAR